MVHPLEGEEAVGCRASLNTIVQHPAHVHEPGHHTRKNATSNEVHVVIMSDKLYIYIYAFLLCLRQHTGFHSVGMFAIIDPHFRDRSHDESDAG